MKGLLRMTNQEIETIRNTIARLKEKDLGCSIGTEAKRKIDESLSGYRGDASMCKIECATRNYLDTWIIGALECLLPGENRDPKLAVRLSER